MKIENHDAPLLLGVAVWFVGFLMANFSSYVNMGWFLMGYGVCLVFPCYAYIILKRRKEKYGV